MASPSRVGGASRSERITDEHSGSGTGAPHSTNNAQEPRGEDKKNPEVADGGSSEGATDNLEGEERMNADEGHDQTLPEKIGDPSTSSQPMDGKGQDLNPPNPQLQSDHGGDREGEDDGTGRHIADGENEETQEGGIKQSGKTKEERSLHHQTSEFKLALKESEFLVEVSHPNIVKLEGFVEDVSAHKVWLIFLWEEHGNLRDFLASGEWEIPERISLINDVTLGLEYLHSRDPPICHGDLKSLNILVNSKCHALITDFGSARHLRNDGVAKQPKEDADKPRPATDASPNEQHITLEALFSATTSTLSLTGSSYTLRWAAPELLQDEQRHLRSDIWALGWIAYEVMTNTIPFHDVKKDAIVINRVIQGNLPAVTEHARMSLIRALCSLMKQSPTQTIDEDTSQLRHAQLLNILGNMYRRQSDYVSALACFSKSLDIYTNRNDDNGRAETLRHLADVHRFRNEYAEAIALYSESLQISANLIGDSKRTDAIFGLADAHLLRREYDEAKKLYLELMQAPTTSRNKRLRADALCGLAEVHRSQDKDNKAMNLYSEALEIYTEVGDQRERALTLWSLAEMYRLRGAYSEAAKLYSEALQTYTDIADHKERANALWGLASIHRLRAEYTEATKLYSEALKICTDIGSMLGAGAALWGLAELNRLQGEYDEATKLYSEASQIFIGIGDTHWQAQPLLGLARVHEVQDHHREAISFYTKAYEVFAEAGKGRDAADAFKNASAIRTKLEGIEEGFTGTDDVEKEPLLVSE
ncbi:hypothetical protein FRC01_000326 [Tulasnella sp. 417]|nr:hypothetical protein FRC01_000326 [Tulasnella sp. 417]